MVPGASPADAFYHRLVMAAPSVLDVGCGTGALLHHARAAGHRGDLAGLDPDPELLAHARRRTDVEWVLGTAAAMPWEQEFDLAVMTGPAFQGLSDGEIRAALAGVRAALREGGRFAFGTSPRRNLDVLNLLVRQAGFHIDAQYGDWHNGPVTPVSREIVTVATRR